MKETYQELMRKKKRFIIVAIIFAFLVYFMLPISLSLFPEKMNQTSFIPGVSWAWVYAFLQFIMIWLLGFIYHQKSKKLDEVIEQMIQEE